MKVSSEDFIGIVGLLVVIVVAFWGGYSAAMKRTDALARALRDGEARVIAYQIDTQHCRAVLWQGQRLEETCEGEK